MPRQVRRRPPVAGVADEGERDRLTAFEGLVGDREGSSRDDRLRQGTRHPPIARPVRGAALEGGRPAVRRGDVCRDERREEGGPVGVGGGEGDGEARRVRRGDRLDLLVTEGGVAGGERRTDRQLLLPLVDEVRGGDRHPVGPARPRLEDVADDEGLHAQHLRLGDHRVTGRPADRAGGRGEVVTDDEGLRPDLGHHHRRDGVRPRRGEGIPLARQARHGDGHDAALRIGDDAGGRARRARSGGRRRGGAAEEGDPRGEQQERPAEPQPQRRPTMIVVKAKITATATVMRSRLFSATVEPAAADPSPNRTCQRGRRPARCGAGSAA